jgi:hypothetical protein
VRALSADARASYLAKACGGNEAVQQEVELLLKSHERAKSFLETRQECRSTTRW